MLMAYDLGELVHLTAEFTNPLDRDKPVDPDTVQVTIKDPVGGSDTYTFGLDGQLIRDGEGHYHIDQPADTEGQWVWRWSSIGGYQAASEGVFTVLPSRL